MSTNSEVKSKKPLFFLASVIVAMIILSIIFVPRLFLTDPNDDTDTNTGSTDNDTNTGSNPPTYTNINVYTAYSMINDTETYPDLIILDVRTQSEYDAGHINGSILIPNTELESRIDEVQMYKDTEIIVYCRTGARSLAAVNILIAHNFTKVYNMEGGITAWDSAGYPTQ